MTASKIRSGQGASEKRINELAKQSGQILDKIQGYSLMNPDATFYEVQSELEAAQLLLAMAAMIKETKNAVKNKFDRATYEQVARDYRAAVQQGRALQKFRDMTEEDQLELYGLKLVARRVYAPGEEPAGIIH